MRIHSLILGALAAGVSLAGALAADVTVDGWVVKVVSEKADPIDKICALWSPETPEGVQMRVANRLDPDVADGQSTRGSGGFLVKVPDKVSDQPTAKVTTVTFSVDGPQGKEWREDTATWTASNGLVRAFVEDRIDALLPAIARGKTFRMSLTTASGEKHDYSVALDGSQAAVAAYEDCLAGVSWVKPKG